MYPLPILARFATPHRCFDHVVAAIPGMVVAVPEIMISGCLKNLPLVCPVPWHEIWSVLDVETALEDDLVRAFEGKDAVVWSAGAGGGNPGRTYAVDRDAAIRSMGAALRAGVRRYVMVSYFGAGPDHGISQDAPFHAYAQAKAAADAHLRSSGLDWTILGPATLTLEKPTGTIDLAPLRESAGRTVSRGNVALTIQAALEMGETIGRTLEYVDGATDIREAFRSRG